MIQTCDKCATDISGAREAYGGLGETLCYSCWFDPGRIRLSGGQTRAEAQAEIDKKTRAIRDHEQEMDFHKSQINELENEIAELQEELTGRRHAA